MEKDYDGMLSSGEVVLIDTRQHWVALVRFAIRPVLLAGLAVLLAAINQWIQLDTLGIVNDVIHWVIVALIIVAVVWLPVDVVRWWSRRYLLTNRRAMRMEGVVRRSSFDSSLEQINDIVTTQSFLGRQLGYADITLLTASDSRTETYDQLLDGLQFKKAVLDAKEAIRVGSPLAALPEGFITKGGTNEASRRADGKLAATVAAASLSEASPDEPPAEARVTESTTPEAATEEPEATDATEPLATEPDRKDPPDLR